MTDKNTNSISTNKALVEKIRSGNQTVWNNFIRDNFKTIANFMASVIKEPNKAGLLTTATFSNVLNRIGGLAATQKSIASWLIHQAKEVCFDSLTTEEYAQTVFKRGLELYSSPPHLKPIPDKIIDSDLEMSAEFVDTIYDGLEPECELLLELVFLEKIPPGEVAELLGISDNLINSFLFSIISALGNFASFQHQDECRPDLFLCIETIKALSDQEELKKKITQASRCESCTSIILRTVKCNQLFSVDRRPTVRPDSAVLAELSLNRKTREINQKISTFVPIPVRAGRTHKTSIGRTLFPVLIIAIFILGTLEIFHENMISSLMPPRIRNVFDVGNKYTGRAHKKAQPKTLGYCYGPASPRSPLLPGQQILTKMRSGLVAEYTTGHKATVDAKSCINTFAQRIILARGSVHLNVKDCEKEPFAFETKNLNAKLSNSSIAASSLPSRGTRLAVLSGEAQITLNDGTTFALQQDQYILVGSDGKYDINDGTFDKGKSSAFGNISPIPGTSDTVDRTILKKETIVKINKDRKTTKVQKDPMENPAPPSFGGTNTNAQTGYRNHF